MEKCPKCIFPALRIGRVEIYLLLIFPTLGGIVNTSLVGGSRLENNRITKGYRAVALGNIEGNLNFLTIEVRYRELL